MAAPFTDNPLMHPVEHVLLEAGTHDVVTAYLPTPSAVEDAAARLTSAVEAAERQLDHDGAAPELIERMAAAAQRAGHGDGEHLVVVADDQDSWTWPVWEPIDRVQTHRGRLPRVAPLLAAYQRVVPHLVALVDREGADLEFRRGQLEVEESEVHGRTGHIHRGHPGGMSQRRFQQRAENTWEHNAGLVAEVIEEMVAEHDPELVLVTGDEHAVHFLVDEKLSTDTRKLTRKLEHGGRAEGADRQQLDEEIRDQLRHHRAAGAAALLEDVRDGLARDLAHEDWAPVLDALFQGLVDTILVRAPHNDDRSAFHGPEPEQVAASAEPLRALDIEPTEGPAVEIAVRAALATGARVWFLDDGAPTPDVVASLRARAAT